MAHVTVGELLEHGMRCEEILLRYYIDVRDRSHDNDARLLTYFLSRHRRQQSQTLNTLPPAIMAPQQGVKVAMRTPLTSKSTNGLLTIPPDQIAGVVLLKAALSYDRECLNVYKKIRRQPVPDALDKLLATLIEREEKHVSMLQKMLGMHYF